MHTNSNGWDDSMLISAALLLVGFFLRMHLLQFVIHVSTSLVIPYHTKRSLTSDSVLSWLWCPISSSEVMTVAIQVSGRTSCQTSSPLVLITLYNIPSISLSFSKLLMNHVLCGFLSSCYFVGFRCSSTEYAHSVIQLSLFCSALTSIRCLFGKGGSSAVVTDNEKHCT